MSILHFPSRSASRQRERADKAEHEQQYAGAYRCAATAVCGNVGLSIGAYDRFALADLLGRFFGLCRLFVLLEVPRLYPAANAVLGLDPRPVLIPDCARIRDLDNALGGNVSDSLGALIGLFVERRLAASRAYRVFSECEFAFLYKPLTADCYTVTLSSGS